MPTKRRTIEECKRIIAAYKRAGGVKEDAARDLDMPVNTFKSAYVDAVRRLGEPETEPVDHVQRRRDRNKEVLQRRRIVELERQAAADRTIREAVFKLSERPLEPPSWNPRPSKGSKHRESIVLFLSDIHMGEVVSMSAMGGRNSYNMKIAGARLERYFQSVVKLGTEWGRALFGEAFWVNLAYAKVADVLDHGGRVVIDDCRFRNEAEALRGVGGTIVRISRPGVGPVNSHCSEAGIEADHEIVNDRRLLELYAEIDRLLAQ